ncbi:glycosyltransferase involved in cell wall biosynthesis [Zymomonas mobilis]|uniref:glycosyltransferase family 2 protein n=1 Tax=Zymomonas mobilis TaxID=542 RepID=UPI0011509A46|nr:glycosyltransferase family 2 protein [Zymomonas mobilis]TQL29776.1 glycosyltransferase involved in cell wall biosynthesis [Zymomonas mobilis]
MNEILSKNDMSFCIPRAFYGLRVAVLIPCYNEEVTIKKVICDFLDHLPEATIYVYDNNSTDRTAELAYEAGAEVYNESSQGKGCVIRRMFADIEADLYVLVDGDATYDASASPQMLNIAIEQNLDMVTGLRVTDRQDAYRSGHVLGNKIFTSLVRYMFGRGSKDIFSGYRVFSRRFVKSFPALSSGFEIETEFTVHALTLLMPIGDIETASVERPEGSLSKLNTYRDGLRILNVIFTLLRKERPLFFFGILGTFFCLSGIFLGIPVIMEFLRTGCVLRLPTAVLATGFITLAALSFCCGQIIDNIAVARFETRRLNYLAYPSIRKMNDR